MVEIFDDLEFSLCRRINAFGSRPRIRRFFTAVSRLGDHSAYVVAGITGAVAMGRDGAQMALHLAVTAGVATGVYRLLKDWFVRERPFITHASILCREAPLDRYSFPSGHTMHAVAFAILLPAYLPAMALVMWPFAVLVALSRVILGLHYPSDVAAGALLGYAIAQASLAVVA